MNHIEIMTLALAVFLGGCSGSVPTGEQSKQAAEIMAPAVVPKTSQGKGEMSSLESVLTVFLSKDGTRWDSYNGVPGIQWRDVAPVENPDATESGSSRYRSGNVLLTGFGMVDVPDGKVGADAGVKKDNEGNSGITLNGDANSVKSIAIMKFYPSDNYQEILQRQLSGGAGALKLIADQCALDYGTTAENTQKNMFYQVSLLAGLVYAEAYVDEVGGQNNPGSTTFEFSKEKPTQRIASMRCREK